MDPLTQVRHQCGDGAARNPRRLFGAWLALRLLTRRVVATAWGLDAVVWTTLPSNFKILNTGR